MNSNQKANPFWRTQGPRKERDNSNSMQAAQDHATTERHLLLGKGDKPLPLQSSSQTFTLLFWPNSQHLHKGKCREHPPIHLSSKPKQGPNASMPLHLERRPPLQQRLDSTVWHKGPLPVQRYLSQTREAAGL